MTDEAPAGRPDEELIGFHRHAERRPDRVAVATQDGAETTYGELAAAVNQVSHALRATGLVLGDRVALLLGNVPEFFAMVFGAGQVGMPPVPINTHLTVGEVAYIVRDSGARLVVADAAHAATAAAALATLDRPATDLVQIGGPTGPHRDYADFLAGRPVTAPADRVHAQTMLYTSGTTGRPKGVSWPISASVDPESAELRTDPMMRLRGMLPDPAAITLVGGPLYHGLPGSWGTHALHRGHTVLLTTKWEAEDFLSRVQEHRVTTAQLAPIHFHRLLALPREVRESYDLSSLHTVCHAGSATPVPVKQAMMEWWGPVLWEYYGSSEGWGTSIGPKDWLAHPGSVGRHDGNGATMRILDDAGVEVPPGEVGTLWIRNPGGVTSSYLGDEDKTAAMRRGEFYTAGDAGRIDADGWLYIVDRRTDLILSGSVNVYPAEVEDALRAHPEVGEVAVVGRPDPEWGQRVHAVVVPAPGVVAGPELAERIRGHARSVLAGFKVPREIEFRTALPYSAAGKLLRRRLRSP